MTAIQEMLEELVVREGGYSNRKADRGGPTNFGITQKALAEWRKRPVTAEDVKSLTKGEAFKIYESNYYVHPKINTLPEVVQEQVFDIGVNSGPGTGIRLLQEVLNSLRCPCTADGGIGPQTLSACSKALITYGPMIVGNELVDKRKAFYQAIVDNDKTGLQKANLNGWMNRAESFRQMQAPRRR